MKLPEKIFIALILLVVGAASLSLFSSRIYAVDLTATSPAGPKMVANQQQRIARLKNRGDQEINRRLMALNNLINRINATKNISAGDKSTLTSQVQSDITNLTSLKTKIDADTDLPTLQADVKSIVNDYRIYVFFLRQIRILAASDRMQTAAGNLTLLAGKLQDRITKAQTAGKNVSSLQALLSDMQAKIADAKTQYAAASSEVVGLTAAGWPGNKSSLDDAIAKIKVGATDLRTARQDAVQIVSGLKALKGAR